jgi:5-methyltetrahydrofolate--homocysteine methyltransferase
MIIGTVAGDIHDLGKNIVKMMFEGAGFEVIDVGTNISADAFTEAYKTHSPQLVGLSTLLTSTMTAMGQIIAQVRETFPDAKFIVGGAPVTQEFADSIKADGYAPDAHSAVSVGRQLIDN